MRMVASTEFSRSTPVTARVSFPPADSLSPSLVPMNALLVRLAMTVSPSSGIASGLKAWPGWPGR